MSIDPTSGPIPAARHENSGSSENRRSESQGSATGSKDGQFSSFWDRAVTGAQKLFSKASLFDNESNEDTVSRNGDSQSSGAALNRGDTASFKVALGFASSGVHRFSSAFATNRGESGLEKGSFDPAELELRDPSEEESNGDIAESSQTDSLIAREYRRGKGEKSADSQAARSSIVDSDEQSSQKIRFLVVDNQTVEDPLGKVGINSAKQGVEMPSKLQSPKLPNLPGPASAKAESAIAALREHIEGQSKPIDGMKAGHTTSGKAISSQSPEEVLAQSKKKGSADLLGFGLAKAKKSHSTASEAAQSSKSNGNGQVSQTTASVASHANSQTSSIDQTTAKASELENGGSRGSEDKGAKQENRNAAVSPSRGEGLKLGNHSVASGETVAAERHVQRSNTETIEAHFNRVSKGIDSSSRQVAAGNQQAGNQIASKKVGGIVSPNHRLELSRPVDGGVNSRIGEKVDAEGVRSGELSSKAARAKGENIQGLNLSESPSASKANVLSFIKPQQSGYASKTTSETKLVYEALAKSADRLVSSKSDSISVTINFDGGGMLKLRVSVESGRVNSVMQTDLSGLESMIKASWAELSSELNQKGIKLNAPQFSNSDPQGNRDSSSLDSPNKEANAEGGGTRDSRKGSGDSLPSSTRQSSFSENRSEVSQDLNDADQDDIVEDQELKTYA